MAVLYSVGDLVAELHDVSALLDARAGSATAGDNTRMADGIGKSIISKIHSLRQFKALDALKLTDAVEKTNLPTDAKHSLHTAIEQRLAGDTVVDPTTPVAIGSHVLGQNLTHVNRYLTQSDLGFH